MNPTIQRITCPGRWYAVFVRGVQVTRAYRKASAAELLAAAAVVRGLA